MFLITFRPEMFMFLVKRKRETGGVSQGRKEGKEEGKKDGK